MPNLYEYTLAGLLHDIGKVGQRAFRDEAGLSPQSRSLEAQVCIPRRSHYTHRHVLYTAEFIDRYARTVQLRDVDWDVVFRLAVYHHRPTDSDTALIQRADHISSRERAEDEVDSRAADLFRRRALKAITNEVDLRGRSHSEWCIPLRPLDAGDPFPEFDAEHDRTAEHASLWRELSQAWQSNAVTDPWGYIGRGMSILERYTACVPAATNVYPDISLFDHLRTSAAIAACLACCEDDHRPFIVASADMGGIQDYIYDIRFGGGMARKLRARSLYVSLVLEATIHRILRRLGLCLPNAVLHAGGRCTLLLPNSSETKAVLAETEQQLAEWMRAEVSCRLYPHFAFTEVTDEDLQREFPRVLSQLAARLKSAKARPLEGVLTDGGQWDEQAFVLPAVVEGSEELCDSCHRTGGRLREVAPGEQQVLCDRCASDIWTGRHLVDCRYLALFEFAGASKEGSATHALPFGYSFRLERSDREAIKHRPAPYLILDLDGGTGTDRAAPVVGRYVARYVPYKVDPEADGRRLLEFGEIAERAKGHKLLAYLKADVDDLGRIFCMGLRGEDSGGRASISRIATLSRSLELFFGGYVAHLARSYENIYTVYSGGDDLLVVGPWDAVMDLAIRLREEFARFTCQNPSWSMSTSVVLSHPKMPVLLAAQYADERLEQAKAASGNAVLPWSAEQNAPVATRTSRQWYGDSLQDQPGKDRLVALGTIVPWQAARRAVERAKSLLAWLESKALGVGQVRRLLRYAQMFQHWQETGDGFSFRCFPYLAYDIRRNWQDAPEEARRWAEGLLAHGNKDMPLLRFVCEYALRAARGAGEESDAQ